MSQRKPITPFLKNILLKVTEMKLTSDFRLVGGTALALQISHRQSLDIDMFSDNYKKIYDYDKIYRELKKNVMFLADLNLIYLSKTGLTLNCNSTKKKESFKIDFWKWPNSFLTDPLIVNGVRMASLEDLAAMKLEAINDRNNYRDYVDIAFLSEKFTFSEMMQFYTKRTLSKDITRIISALSNPEELVKDQKLKILKNITEKHLKEKVNYMLFVFTKEQERKGLRVIL